MPIYEYACANCGHHLEVKQRLSDPALRLCPSCNAEALERLISESSFALRGGGWYADGYGPGGKKDAAGAAGKTDTTAAPAKADKPEKAESKPEKAESKPEKAESKPATTSKPSE